MMPERVLNPMAGAIGTSPTWIRLGIGALAIISVFVPIFPRLVSEWAAFPNLSHGFAVPFIAAYLLWSRREWIAEAPAQPSWLGLPILMLGLAVYAAGSLGEEPFPARLALPVALFGMTLFLAGSGVTRQATPAIAYLLFMVPLPYITLKNVTDRRREIDATAVATVLPWVGVPVFQEGYLLHLPKTTLEVADVCSSIPAITALLATGAAYGMVSYRPLSVRIILLLAAAPLGIASNIVRIILTAAGAYYLGPIALHNVVHAWSGATVFIMTLCALILVDNVLRRLIR
jgi:exosortase